MAIRAAQCLKIETAGLVIGWIYLIAFSIGFVAALVSSIVGMKIYISGGDGILQALLIFFVMIVALTLLGLLAFLCQDFIKGVENRTNAKVRNFKVLIACLLLLSFIFVIISLIGATQTFEFQKSFWHPSTPPLGLQYVLFAVLLFALHFAILVVVDIIQKKFHHYEMRSQIYKENMNLNVVSSYQARPHSMKIPDIELPPPPSKF
ncbi:unnamed protein product [Chironomus riparius]|uniref:Uncharacterized protein n=1 Tax=Chironomus riparius TaxID=315576 RepID=A0A9N9RMC4_9DIPT|nr:unnamed protein product [Chironomus riparius]